MAAAEPPFNPSPERSQHPNRVVKSEDSFPGFGLRIRTTALATTREHNHGDRVGTARSLTPAPVIAPRRDARLWRRAGKRSTSAEHLLC